MRVRLAEVFLLAFALTASAQTESPKPTSKNKPARSKPGPPVFQAQTNSPALRTNQGQVYIYDQRPVPPRPPLIPEDQATNILERFKTAYAMMGRPRLLICVNHKLSGTNLGTTAITSGQDASTVATQSVQGETSGQSPQAGQPTERDVERFFGRPLRVAGVHLVDQQVLQQKLSPDALQALAHDGDQSRKAREALSQSAEIVIEILVSSNPVTAVELTGQDTTYAAPEIRATAIHLKDAKILGQASTADLYGGAPSPVMVRNYSVQSISEATALALMDDVAAELDAGK